jgi:3-hydroxyacyl-[acyl-carrier-protein] dehydratase
MLECEILQVRGPIGKGKAVARVDGKVAAQATLTFVVGE